MTVSIYRNVVADVGTEQSTTASAINPALIYPPSQPLIHPQHPSSTILTALFPVIADLTDPLFLKPFSPPCDSLSTSKNPAPISNSDSQHL